MSGMALLCLAIADGVIGNSSVCAESSLIIFRSLVAASSSPTISIFFLFFPPNCVTFLTVLCGSICWTAANMWAERLAHTLSIVSCVGVTSYSNESK